MNARKIFLLIHLTLKAFLLRHSVSAAYVADDTPRLGVDGAYVQLSDSHSKSFDSEADSEDLLYGNEDFTMSGLTLWDRADFQQHQFRGRKAQEVADCNDSPIVTFSNTIYTVLVGAKGRMSQPVIKRAYQQIFRRMFNRSTDPRFQCILMFEVAVVRQDFYDWNESVRRELETGVEENDPGMVISGGNMTVSERRLARRRGGRRARKLYVDQLITGECRRCQQSQLKDRLRDDGLRRRERFLSEMERRPVTRRRLDDFAENLRVALIGTGYEIFECLEVGELQVTGEDPRCIEAELA